MLASESRQGLLQRQLMRMSLFRHLTRSELSQVASSCSVRHYAARHVICRKGTRGNQMFLVLSGNVVELSATGSRDGRVFSRGYTAGLMCAMLGREVEVTLIAGEGGCLMGAIPSYAVGKMMQEHGQEFAEIILREGPQCVRPTGVEASRGPGVNFLSFVLDRFRESRRIPRIRSNLLKSFDSALLRNSWCAWHGTTVKLQQLRDHSVKRTQRIIVKTLSGWKGYASCQSKVRVMERLNSFFKPTEHEEAKPSTLEKRVNELLDTIQCLQNPHFCQPYNSDNYDAARASETEVNSNRELEWLKKENETLDAELEYYKQQFESLRLRHVSKSSPAHQEFKSDERNASEGRESASGDEEVETSASVNQEGTITSDMSFSFLRAKDSDQVQEMLEQRLFQSHQHENSESNGADDVASFQDAQLVNHLIEQLRTSQLALQSDVRRISIELGSVNAQAVLSQTSSHKPWGSVSADLVVSHHPQHANSSQRKLRP